MTKDLIVALIKDILIFLKNEKGFFSLNETERQKIAKQVLFSTRFANYLAHISESEFIDDLQKTLKVLKNSADVHPRECGIMKALGEYFQTDFAIIFDQLNGSFHHFSTENRKGSLQKMLPTKSFFNRTLSRYLLLYSVQEVSEEVVVYLKNIFDSPRIVVQSPVECPTDIKSFIRSYFAQKYPKGFAAFSVNPQLIGGIRFFVNGRVEDRSWFSKVQNLHKLSNLLTS